jgi:hypothetical protein
MMLCIMSEDKLLCVFGIVIMLTKKTKNKEKFLKIFTIQIKMKRKAMNIVKK